MTRNPMMASATISAATGKVPAVRIVSDPDALADAALVEVLGLANEAIRDRGTFRVALAGGSTPRALYERLAGAAGETDFTRWEVFFGDERRVPGDHPDSNFGMAHEALLSHVPIASERVHQMVTDLARPDDAAASYEREILAAFGLTAGAVPRFDLVLLGLGGDGHTASLFPSTTALRAEHQLVASTWVAKLPAYRVTLTARTINAARHVLFLVAGADKAAALASVFAPDGDPDLVPARLIAPTDGIVSWLVDRAAWDHRV